MARIRAILRRTQQQVEDDPIIRVGDLEINEDSHDVSRAGRPIDLSPTEYKLLRYLMDNEGPCAVEGADPRSRLAIRLGR